MATNQMLFTVFNKIYLKKNTLFTLRRYYNSTVNKNTKGLDGRTIGFVLPFLQLNISILLFTAVLVFSHCFCDCGKSTFCIHMPLEQIKICCET